jgi:hypothetical protein
LSVDNYLADISETEKQIRANRLKFIHDSYSWFLKRSTFAPEPETPPTKPKYRSHDEIRLFATTVTTEDMVNYAEKRAFSAEPENRDISKENALNLLKRKQEINH